MEDLASDSIFYVQDGPSSRDAFSFYISDGHSQTEAFSVEINIEVGHGDGPSPGRPGPAQPSPDRGRAVFHPCCPPPSLQSKADREPVVSVSSIHVEENSGVVITNSSLRVVDHDTPENEIIISVIRKPAYGEKVARE